MIKKVIVPAAGLGTRLFPATKEQPKEMLPIFTSTNREMLVKPVVQVVFERLFNEGLREFCFIVGRGKRGIEDHFTPDVDCIQSLEGMGRKSLAADFRNFYNSLRSSTLVWINQPQPKGFGNAVLMAEPFVQNEQCLVHAGDSLIISKNMDYIKKLLTVHERFEADVTFLVLEIENPTQYGIIEGIEVEQGVVKVNSAVEKPDKPMTNMAIMAMYAFRPSIFEALKKTKRGKNDEIQLTDAIQRLISEGSRVYAVKLGKDYSHLDVGSPVRYWEALNLSHTHFLRE